MAAPLIMSTDLRNIREESKALLLNRGAIAVNQDRLGIQGRRIHKVCAGYLHVIIPLQCVGIQGSSRAV